MLKDFEIILCPKMDQAKEMDADITIEAEYGDFCVEGKELTLAHHGSRSDNPAPCNTDAPEFDGGRILISHIDLDTVGGILQVAGEKPEDQAFWAAAEKMDVEGTHHIHELEPEVQDQLNAFYAWNAQQERTRYEEPTEVSSVVEQNKDILVKLIDRDHPEHEQLIEQGREQERDITKQVEDRCTFENDFVRGFFTDGPFCAANYYSPEQDKIIPSTVTYNTKFDSITVAFADGGKEFSAREIVQEMWGPEAGGRDGIAGSPRGQQMSEYDFQQAMNVVMDKQIEREYEKNHTDQDVDPEISGR